MNLLISDMPDSVNIDGEDYRISTDFRDWITFIEMFSDKTLTDEEKIFNSYLWYIDDPPKCEEAIKKLKWFLLCGKEISPNNATKNTFSYDQDAPLLMSAFQEKYQINLFSLDYMHWWEFKALFEGLSDECTLKKYMYYRSINLSEIKDKDERKRIRKIQQQIRIVKEMDDEEIGDALWGMM